VPRVFLLSPKEGLYSENSVTLAFCGQTVSWGIIEYSNVKYWLDGKVIGQLDSLDARRESEAFTVDLTKVPDGRHSLEVTATISVVDLTIWYIEVPWGKSIDVSSGKTTFIVDTTNPQVSIFPLHLKTLGEEIPINFTVNEPATWIAYCLNGNANTTITDSASLTRPYGIDNYRFVLADLPEGSYNLTVYARDIVGNEGNSERLFFNVSSQPTQQQSEIASPQPSDLENGQPSWSSFATPTGNLKGEVFGFWQFWCIAIILAVCVLSLSALRIKYLKNKRATSIR